MKPYRGVLPSTGVRFGRRRNNSVTCHLVVLHSPPGRAHDAVCGRKIHDGMAVVYSVETWNVYTGRRCRHCLAALERLKHQVALNLTNEEK